MTKFPTGRHSQTIKSAKKNSKNYLRNKSLRSRAKTCIRKVAEAVEKRKFEEAKNLMPEASKYIDKVVSKGAMHINRAARLKSRLEKKISRAETEK